jgi:hypothetical protein
MVLPTYCVDADTSSWFWQRISIVPVNPGVNFIKLFWPYQCQKDITSGLYYKCFTIVIYDCNDSGQYYKTTIVVKASLS